MAEDGGRGGFDIVGDDDIATLDAGESARDGKETDGRARACSEGKSGPVARPANQRDEIFVERRLDAHALDFLPCGGEPCRVNRGKFDGLEPARIESLAPALKNF